MQLLRPYLPGSAVTSSSSLLPPHLSLCVGQMWERHPDPGSAGTGISCPLPPSQAAGEGGAPLSPQPCPTWRQAPRINAAFENHQLTELPPSGNEGSPDPASGQEIESQVWAPGLPLFTHRVRRPPGEGTPTLELTL